VRATEGRKVQAAGCSKHKLAATRSIGAMTAEVGSIPIPGSKQNVQLPGHDHSELRARILALTQSVDRERFIGLLRVSFNGGVRFRGLRLKWDTVLEEKTSELARFLTGKTSTVDFEEPSPKLDRLDDRELRERINSLTSYEAKERGLGKSTLHYLRRNARSERPFRVYGKVREKLLAV